MLTTAAWILQDELLTFCFLHASVVTVLLSLQVG